MEMVTVIVPMYNEERYILDCLNAILSQDYQGSMEVLVIDGGSTDASRQIVHRVMSESRIPIRLLCNPKRIVPTSLNMGIRAAQGDIVVRVDAHSVIEKDYVRKCVEYLQSSGADNVGGLMRPIHNQTRIGQSIALAMSCPFGVGTGKFHYSEREEFVDTVYLGAYRKSTLLALGGYDETFLRNQDYELNYRIRRAGGKILLTPAIKSQYYTRSSLRKLWSQYLQYGFWKVQMLRKHPRSVRGRQLVPPVFVLILLFNGALSAISSLAAWVFVLVVASYLSLSLAFSFSIAARKGWRYLPILPVIFACLHLSWGLGFLYSLAQLTFQWLVRR
ncbi:MAG: glycosyltransferase [Anaerolineales bacterium]|nr:MAG: glycosyltransferase [Anaerolineales bacterium]